MIIQGLDNFLILGMPMHLTISTWKPKYPHGARKLCYGAWKQHYGAQKLRYRAQEAALWNPGTQDKLCTGYAAPRWRFFPRARIFTEFEFFNAL